MGLLEDKVGMVTGGGSGIGRATCLKFANEGARVVVVDINEDDAEATVAAIKAAGGDATHAIANVGDEHQVAHAIRTAMDTYGGLHVASNNAALSVGGHLLADIDAADFIRTYEVTVNGVFYCMKYQIPAMIESGGGAIVNIGSRAADQPNIMMSPYDSAKAAVNGLTRSAAKEYARQAIRVNCINPGVIRTEGIEKYLASDEKHEPRMTRGIAMKRLGLPDELADAVVWLCSDRASYITGQSVSVDGGMLG
ncbi:MAG: SDR family oxidoreductase [Gammaproteobacteria bacterium]|nr:SDR family oxidoreductase [Gammaproteobacteria bacterium]MDH3371863.1 SDR family oxidoreductase [Gammaproteobacteria bacterium]MDH3407808.1 SDR family oxidoreductase [Gammaproteobacteria bacterium]MDH3551155.1 SDR family oxidoreductase [Gammaproteobacteria bacterium]